MLPTARTRRVKEVLDIAGALTHNFLGNAPHWYKQCILALLLINPLLLYVSGGFTTGWILIAEFIFTLIAALWCYPFAPAGLLVLEAVFLGMAGTDTAGAILKEVVSNVPVILLLIFMVPAVAFNKGLLVFLFTKVLINTRSKIMLSLFFCLKGIVLSAWLDALTVIAVVIGVSSGFYAIYHKFASGKAHDNEHAHDHTQDDEIMEHHRDDLAGFRQFLQNIVMHAAVGTALGGVMTLVGEPQNIIVGHKMGWGFIEFFWHMAPVTIPTLVTGLITCFVLERKRLFGYGYELPERVREIIQAADKVESERRTLADCVTLWMQGTAVAFLIIGLGTHIAEVGLVGLGVLIFVSAFTGNPDEHKLGEAFKESMPFAAILVVFFVLVTIIHEQHLFGPLIQWVLGLEGQTQLLALFGANALLSAISDNVFVALTYITELQNQFDAGMISRQQYELLAVAINTGTNLPSVATPNGQAAFLFLLTSPLAGLIRLSYGKMCLLALPYTVVLTTTSTLAVLFFL